MNKRLQLWSFAIPAVLAFLLIGACIYMWIAQIPVPQDLRDAAVLATGYVFGNLPALWQNAAGTSTGGTE